VNLEPGCGYDSRPSPSLASLVLSCSAIQYAERDASSSSP
jgi:hypothetical protein